MSDYEVARSGGTCCITGRPFEEDEPFYSVVVETADGFERRDYCADAWTGPPDDAICHFKTHMPRKQAPKRTFVDESVLLTFFDRLQEATEPAKQRFRFVLALILLRKRILRYENSRREGDGETWVLRRVGDRSRQEIFNPGLSEGEIGEITSQLGAVLHADLAAAGAADNDEDSEPDESDGRPVGEETLT